MLLRRGVYGVEHGQMGVGQLQRGRLAVLLDVGHRLGSRNGVSFPPPTGHLVMRFAAE